MAEESEKKPEFVIHKKQPESGSTPATKKRVVVVKKSSAPAAADNSSETQKRTAVRVVVKQKDNDTQKTVQQSPVSPQPKPVQKTDKSDFAQKNTAKVSRSQQPKSDERNEQRKTFELNTARPNVKAGNLSDARSSRGGYNRGGYNNGSSGYNNGNSGFGRNNRRNNDGSFTGSQARQGYQDRERGGQGQNQNRDGQNRPYGQNRGNFQNRPFNNRGGQNQGGQRFGQGGFRSGGGAPGSVPPMMQGRTPAKTQFKGKKQIYKRKDEEQFDDKFFEQKKKSDTPVNVVPKSIDIMETISVSDLARKMNLKASDLIAKLMAMGMMVTITQSIDSDTATLLAEEYGCTVNLISLYDETVIESDAGDEATKEARPPIVTVMGHVDHGKTKTLDAIRNSHVAEGEFGGITQHIGAYSVTTEKGRITFLDTPGHEAFTMMRARGAQVTDIVVLVVAADDGVMPQTLEAISHAKDAKVPIIVAVNKVDKPEANPDRVKTQLSEHGLTPEEWGGDTQYVHISALKGEGIDDLLDAILLQAEVLELKANYDCRAEGKILESRIDKGRGVVSSVIVQQGTLSQGDPFVAGIYSGRVRALFNDLGQRIDSAGPSTPVEILGMEEMPNAGDPFQVTESEKEARAISTKRQELKRFEDAKAVKKVTLDNLYSTIEQNEIKEFKVIIKADLQGSAEALKT